MTEVRLEGAERLEGEIIYERPDGTLVHSDIGPGKPEHMSDEVWRKYVHDLLDEWLDKSRGTGVFYIGDPNHHYIG